MLVRGIEENNPQGTEDGIYTLGYQASQMMLAPVISCLRNASA